MTEGIIGNIDHSRKLKAIAKWYTCSTFGKEEKVKTSEAKFQMKINW